MIFIQNLLNHFYLAFFFGYIESLPETGYKIKQDLYSQRFFRSQAELASRYFNDATFYAKIINLFSFN